MNIAFMLSEVSNNPDHLLSPRGNRAGDLEHTRVGFGSQSALIFGVIERRFINVRI